MNSFTYNPIISLFSCKSNSTITNVHLSVCLSGSKTPQPLIIKPICHYACQIDLLYTYQPSCQSATMPLPLIAIMPISDYAYQPSCPNTPLSLSDIIPISHQDPSDFARSPLASRAMSLSYPDSSCLFSDFLRSLLCKIVDVTDMLVQFPCQYNRHTKSTKLYTVG